MTEAGIINLNKHAGITSHGCVSAIRKITGVRRVGHTGTLDPMASGVLPVCIGTAVRITEYLDMDLKKYRAEMTLGLTTETQDIWGNVVEDRRGELKERTDISAAAVKAALESFTGETEQTPPKYSAVRVGGKRLYAYARAGEEVEIKKRKVFIKEISLNGFDPEANTVSFDVTCGKGTYIRTICHDVGAIFGCGGTMSGLTRLAAGAFKIEDAVSLDTLSKLSAEEIGKLIRPADYPLVRFGKAVITDGRNADRFINGEIITLSEVSVTAEPEWEKPAYNIYFNNKGETLFLGVAVYDAGNEKFDTDKVFVRRIS